MRKVAPPAVVLPMPGEAGELVPAEMKAARQAERLPKKQSPRILYHYAREFEPFRWQ